MVDAPLSSPGHVVAGGTGGFVGAFVGGGVGTGVVVVVVGAWVVVGAGVSPNVKTVRSTPDGQYSISYDAMFSPSFSGVRHVNSDVASSNGYV